jgi:hypothetical protein
MNEQIQAQAPPLETDALYGYLCLSSYRSEESPLKFPFHDLLRTYSGNHVSDYDSFREGPFDYCFGGGTKVEPEFAKLSNTTRGVTISGMRVGDVSDENQTKHIIYNLLTLNTNSTEEDKDTPYLNLVYSKISKSLTGRFFAAFEVTSTRSKFVLISRAIPVYMFVACDDKATYLIWSNEETLRERMREVYQNQFFYYPLRPLTNGTLVIQSFYLKRLIKKWRASLHSDLRVMNVLDEYLRKRTLANI